MSAEREAEGQKKKNSSKKGGNKKNNKDKKKMQVILFSVEILILMILGVVLFLVREFTGGGNGQQDGGVEKVNLNEANLGINEELTQSGYWDEVNATSSEDGQGKGYMQVALFGVDSRQGELSRNTRTDSIIIASINQDTGEVKLVSVFRDTYLNLSNDTYNKCNSAYAKGGPEQAIQMLNMNLDLNIENYITVGFKGVVDTVNSLGGVNIDITSAEISHLNNYQSCIAEDLGIANYTQVTNTGLQTLDGLQACAYCRIRYTAGDDFKRAERQRTVLTQMSERAKAANPATLATIATDAFSNVSTSFDLSDILDVAANVSRYTVVGSEGFPFADYRTTGTIGNKGSCVVPVDLTTNVSQLHNFLFGVENYDPSSTVKECSERIHSDTVNYVGR